MSRNPELEALFAARYAWENAAGAERAEHLRDYHRLLDEALAKAAIKAASREEIEDALVEAYREFRRARRLDWKSAPNCPDFAEYASSDRSVQASHKSIIHKSINPVF